MICRKFELEIFTGSVVAYSVCGGMYYMGFVHNLLLIITVKEF